MVFLPRSRSFNHVGTEANKGHYHYALAAAFESGAVSRLFLLLFLQARYPNEPLLLWISSCALPAGGACTALSSRALAVPDDLGRR